MRKIRLFASVTALIGFTNSAYAQTMHSDLLRAKNIVAQMTLEEKAGQYMHNAPAIPRLNIPAYNWWNEGLHGVARAGYATVFPQAIGLAASFDEALIEKTGDVIATEFRAKYLANIGKDGSSAQYKGLTVWSPNVNIFRDPRWGRGQETYGEDPYLTTRLGVSFIKGLQGSDKNNPKTMAIVKHLAVHSGPEAGRHRDNILPSERDLTETYLPAFFGAVTEANVNGVMCAYNAVNNQPACANTRLLHDILRKDWKFSGHVVSDCAAIADVYLKNSHAYTKTPEEALAVSIKAGTDLNCDFVANDTAKPEFLVSAVKKGLLEEKLLDQALIRLFEARYRLGTLETIENRKFKNIKATDFDTKEHREFSESVAQDSLVLLKNNGLLPLLTVPKKIAVIGPNANSIEALVGNYNGTPSDPVTILKGIKDKFKNSDISYIEGTGLVGPPVEDVPNNVLCIDEKCAKSGIILEEYNNLDLSGTATLTKEEGNVKYSWGRPQRQERKTSIKWTGFIKPQETGSYRFRYTGDNGYKIYINDKMIVDAWDIAWPTSDSEVNLDKNTMYHIRVEAMQNGSRGDQKLQWSKPSVNINSAISVAKNADLIIFAGGLNARLEGEEMRVSAPGFSGGDRTSIELPKPQQELLEKLHELKKPIILVLMNGSALSVNWADKNIDAIIEAWYPGGEGGKAVANLINGDYSPSAKLPVTFYKSLEGLPEFSDYSMNNRTYKYFRNEVLYKFGHGLSYTKFSYEIQKAKSNIVKAGDSVKLNVKVTNIGKMDSKEAVQLYIENPDANAPIRSLIGFKKIFLKKGESTILSFNVTPKDLSLIDNQGNRFIKPNDIRFWIGSGQPDINNSVAGSYISYRIKGNKSLPKF